jgi:N-acetylglucosaminyldiphosphoundecaprenol N-acetyl-beta-D-mannosaminyltransferase
MVMEAHDAPEFRAMVNRADLVTPDGMPLVWALHWLGVKEASRVDGSTLTLHVCEAAAKVGAPIALYGGSDETLAAFAAFARRQFPGIKISAMISPPFRRLTEEEHQQMLRQLAESGARIVLVALGCPKQETWMAQNYLRLQAVLIGIGAALDFHAGRIARAPEWMQRIGLEWLFRLMMEPGRLWRRYARHNPRFIGLFMLQLLRLGRFDEK